MKVINHKKFCCFEYESFELESKYNLGDVVIGINDLNGNLNSIGVVIQMHDHPEEFRVDMFGNTSDDEVRLATIEEIKKYRPDLLSDLV